MAYQKNLTDLISDMKAKNTLMGWDVLVSYDVDALNGVLQQRSKQLTPLELLEFKTRIPDIISGKVVELNFGLQLLTPAIQFNRETEHVDFSCALSGSFQCDGEEFKLTDNLQLDLSISLVNVAGTWGEPACTADTSGEAVVVKDSGAQFDKDICLHFKSPTATIRSTGGAELDASNAGIAGIIVQHFKSPAGLKYWLKSEGGDTGPGGIWPSSFCFTFESSERGRSTTLSTWIRLRGSSSKGEPLENLKFAPDGNTRVNPIPSGCTASIIFSHQIMAEFYLMPQFSRVWDNVKCVSGAGTDLDGMKFSFNFPSATITVPTISGSYNPGFLIPYQYYQINGSDFNLNSPLAHVIVPSSLVTKGVSGPLSLQYRSDSHSVDWSMDSFAIALKKNLPIYIVLTGSGTWLGSDSSPNTLTYSPFDFGSGAHVSMDPNPSNMQDWWFAFSHQPGARPEQFEGLKPDQPLKNIEPNPFNFNFATNLLFPGQQIFHPDPLIAESLTAPGGLAFPRDIILTGKIGI